MISDKLPQLVLLFSSLLDCAFGSKRKRSNCRKPQKPLGNLGKGGLLSLHCISSGVANTCARCVPDVAFLPGSTHCFNAVSGKEWGNRGLHIVM